MDQLMTKKLDSICNMLSKTREDVRMLRAAVSSLHMVLTGGDDAPPDGMEHLIPDVDENQTELRNAHIDICSRDLCELLQISNATLKRWQANNMLDFKYISATHVSYDLSHVYEGIKSGKLTCKGLVKITAIDRILNYSRKINQLWASENHSSK